MPVNPSSIRQGTSKSVMTKGTIVLVPFPFTDLSSHKVRPALVLSAEKRGEDFVAAFISPKQKREGIFDVAIEPTKRNGLKVSSVLKVDKLATLQKKIALGELGLLEPAYMRAADAKLKKLFRL